MADKVKVFNPQKFDVGIELIGNRDGVSIKAGSFTQISEDDVARLISISTLFQRGILRVEEKASDLVEVAVAHIKDSPNFLDDTEIEKKLGGTQKKLDEWLDTVTEAYIMDRIYDVAVGMDLPVGKIKILQAHMPNKSFIE